MMNGEDERQRRYDSERTRLLETLRPTTGGGVIEAVQPVGSESVPGLAGSGVLDIALAVWPFPLPPEAEGALAGLGYAPQPAADGADERRYEHASGGICLLVSEAGRPPFYDGVLLRDYLRHSEAAREGWARARAGAGRPVVDGALWL